MKTKTITTINGISIVCFTETDNRLVPIKPILEVLKKDYHREVSKLYEHEYWRNTVRVVGNANGDLMEHGSITIPVREIPAWILPLKCASYDTPRDVLMEFKQMCYVAILDYIEK